MCKAIIAAIFVVLCSRLLGANGRGEVSVFLFYVGIFMLLNEFIGGSALSIFASKNELKKYYIPVHFWALCICLVGSVFFCFYYPFIQVFVIALFIFTLASITIHFNIFQGKAKLFERNVLAVLQEIIKLGLLILFFFVLNSKNVFSVMQVLTIASSIVCVIFILITVKNETITWQLAIPNEIIKSGFWAQTGHLIMFLNYRIAILFLEKKFGNETVGIFSNSLLVADMIWIYANTFGGVLHSKILQKIPETEISKLIKKYGMYSVLGTIILCAIVYLIPNNMYVLIFGKDFEALKIQIVYLIPAILLLSVSTIISHYFAAHGKFKIIVFANLVGLLTQTIFIFSTLQQFNSTAPFAVAAGVLGILVVLGWRYYRKNKALE